MKPALHHRSYRLGSAELILGERTLVMGILNVTPDSFSDGGRYNRVDLALEHARQMVEDGADLIDIGGESTRPGHEPVDEREELERVIPVVEALRRELPRVPLSIDTYKARVAREALQAGAHIINDVWGFKADQQMAQVAAEFACPVILMHNRHERNYRDLLQDVAADLRECVELARNAGISDDKIILDPGIGFAKDYTENLRVMQALDELVRLGYPLLLGTSRKRFIRTALDLPVDQVVLGTAATVALGIAQGCQIVRVHDVKEIKRTVQMCDAIVYA
ncbi:MAG: dihydropteroate synthase [Paenibacillus macerans]|uniref:Dihydropteroate synthase n=1 Tax=Paenibacillus macerans TaxID=44252 RepID=A0A6N8F7M2_PAEMA|nr:dihydropteroate synthase [Paenibacillus macerans]MBS5910799.1 dihydropteroate synthase [Paenibacillus macerans]MDU5946224.1 dihydropteroate synthase [Paenibacillus macerans]MDU7476149.1 dihydropteroate synthase [Paenibacillus macerans]MEC0138851.1 dihydropteroate synthase [Paenibacillus macerans]MUG26671.1 dihydropteroate synthase [Paenibacillus macerans]